eukprot:226032-Pleurochrysis_carterae.AAC.2
MHQLADRKCARAHTYHLGMLARKPLHQSWRGTCAHLRLVRAKPHARSWSAQDSWKLRKRAGPDASRTCTPGTRSHQQRLQHARVVRRCGRLAASATCYYSPLVKFGYASMQAHLRPRSYV